MSHLLTVSASRRILAGTVAGVAAFTAAAVAPASAVDLDRRLQTDRQTEWRADQPGDAAPTQRTVHILDGFVIGHTPCGIGSATDFEYEWENVSFHSRVWETGPDAEGATKVDLTLKTVRGEGLTDLEALRTFLTEYHEKDRDQWQLAPVRVGEFSGYLAEDRLFYFVAPGVAAEASIDRTRFEEKDLVKTAREFRPQ